MKHLRVCACGCSPLMIDTQAGQTCNGLALKQVLQAYGTFTTVLGQDISYKTTQITLTTMHLHGNVQNIIGIHQNEDYLASLHHKFSYMV